MRDSQDGASGASVWGVAVTLVKLVLFSLGVNVRTKEVVHRRGV